MRTIELPPYVDMLSYHERPRVTPFEAIRRMLAAVDELDRISNSLAEIDCEDPMQLNDDLSDHVLGTRMKVYEELFRFIERYRYQLPEHRLRVTLTAEGGDQ